MATLAPRAQSSQDDGKDRPELAMRQPTEAEIRQFRARRTTRVAILYSLFAADILALLVGFAVANFAVYGTDDLGQLANVLSVSIPVFVGFGLHDGVYGSRSILVPRISIHNALKTLAFTSATLMLIAFLLKVGAEFSRAQFLLGTSLAAVLLCVFRMGIARAIRASTQHGMFADLHIYDRVEGHAHVASRFAIDAQASGLAPDLSDSAAINRLGTIARGMDSVVVHCRQDARIHWANALRTLDVPTEIVIPELDALNALKITARDGQSAVLLSDGRLPWDQALLKRAFDLIVVIPTLPVLAVIVAIVGIAIKIDSRGPVFFRQDRIGIGNRPFRIWKFRSMLFADQDLSGSKLTERRDRRVTRVGALLRRSSIDELPQLLNVLTGDMSLVGPRPHAAMARAGDRLYWEVDQSYWQRHVVKPGITGLAQVRGFRGNTFQEDNLRDRLRADLEYVGAWSLLLDIRILLGTALVPFHRNAF